jgi:hypothetical protein
VADHLAHELVTQHDVAIIVVQYADVGGGGHGVVVIHEVHVGRTDGRAHDSEQELAGAGNGIRGVADLQTTFSENDRAHPFSAFAVAYPGSITCNRTIV